MAANVEMEDIALGLTASQLARLFKTNVTSVQRRLASVTPIGIRRNTAIYDIAEAAPHLVKAAGNVEELLAKMKPSDLPSALQKDYWAAQLARQQFEEKAGKLWKTERVQAAFGNMLKMIRQRVLLFNDTVERQSGLTDEQRRIVQGMADALLEDFRQGLLDLFGGGYNPEGERDETFENGPPKSPDITPPDDDEEIDDGL